MFIVHYHNEHAYSNPGCCEIYGPLPDIDTAKSYLAKLVESVDDPLFKIDPDPHAEATRDGTYAGYCYETLEENNRNTDLCSEVWAEIVRLTPPDRLPHGFWKEAGVIQTQRQPAAAHKAPTPSANSTVQAIIDMAKAYVDLSKAQGKTRDESMREFGQILGLSTLDVGELGS